MENRFEFTNDGFLIVNDLFVDPQFSTEVVKIKGKYYRYYGPHGPNVDLKGADFAKGLIYMPHYHKPGGLLTFSPVCALMMYQILLQGEG